MTEQVRITGNRVYLFTGWNRCSGVVELSTRRATFFFHVLKLNITNDPNTNDPWSFGPNGDGNGAADIPDAWLVKISSEGDIQKSVTRA